MPENIWRQNQIPFSFLKSEKKPPFFLSLDENEKLCCWGSQQTLVSTFRNEDEDARTNGAFRFLLRFKRQNTSNFLLCVVVVVSLFLTSVSTFLKCQSFGDWQKQYHSSSLNKFEENAT